MAPPADQDGITFNVRPNRRLPSQNAGVGANAVLIGQLAEELADAWRRGQCSGAEDYLNRHPELHDDPEAVAQLVYEEVCVRQELGHEIDPNDYLRRFPRWQSKLAVLLDCHGLLQSSESASIFPNVGDHFEEYRLLTELGRGAQGRVFLATQPLLAERPVVLKLTPCQGQEHWSLARLQHTHIVPLFAAQDHVECNLRSLCMPYLGGANFAQILPMLPPVLASPRTGQHILAALDQIQSQAAIKIPTSGPARQFLGRASYEQAICWIGACLADALHYAHERGLVHFDLKPSNVLLSADGQPMLLDFHLAREPLQPGAPGAGWLGGTPEYMAPEQQRAFAAIRSGQPVTEAVDRRADILALGVLLYEALGGQAPPPKNAAQILRRKNPRVSAGLAAVIGRCVASEASQRYANAASLAEDLRRHLNDLPLRGVSNRSFKERYGKWRRRHPHALAWSAILAGVLFVAAAVAVNSLSRMRDRYYETNLALSEGQQLYEDHAYSRAIQVLTHGLEISRDLPRGDDLRHALTSQLEQAQRAQTRFELHALVERLRFLTEGVDSVSAGELGKLVARCAELWATRDRLLSDASLDALSADEATRVRNDLLELVLFWLDARERLAEGEGLIAIRKEALGILADVNALLGTNRVLERQRQVCADALGMVEEAHAASVRAERLMPQTSWEHYLEGRWLLRARDLESAQSAFAEAATLQPQDFWPHFYQGVCEYRLKRAEAAAAAFGVCIALLPDRAECYYNRGLALVRSGRPEEACRDFDRALQLAPNLAAASLERAVLHYQAKQYRKALDDLNNSLAHGADPATVHYNEALVYQALQDFRSARASLEQALRANPGHKAARALSFKLQGAP